MVNSQNERSVYTTNILLRQVPLFGVHHMQAHALTPRLVNALDEVIGEDARCSWPDLKPEFPFLSLLVSGGHTLFIHSIGVADHRILASTNDIAIGDCLDKCARSILPRHVLDASSHVSYGSLLESFAFPANIRTSHSGWKEVLARRTESPYGWQLPIPLLATRGGKKSKSMEFSFTGLATSAIRIATNGWIDGKLGTRPRGIPMPEEEARFLAKEVMRIAFQHLASRVVLQLNKEREAHNIMPTTPLSKTLVVSGGVAANRFLRQVLGHYLTSEGYSDVKLLIPPNDLCTDNAAMIAWTAFEMISIQKSGLEPEHLEIDVLKKWSLENILHPEKEANLQDSIGDAAAKAPNSFDNHSESSLATEQASKSVVDGVSSEMEVSSSSSTRDWTSKVYRNQLNMDSSAQPVREANTTEI